MRPFGCGTQFADWESANCARCKKGTFDDLGTWPTCPIQAALVEAYWADGHITDEIADRMARSKGRYNWPCGEAEWTEEWKAKCDSNHKSASGRGKKVQDECRPPH